MRHLFPKVGVVLPGYESQKAEIFWLAKVASNNFSLRSTNNLGDLFKAMFPDSKIAANFHLSCTSSSYMISEGLSPYFTRMIVNDLLKSSLLVSLHFDNTTTAQVKRAPLVLGSFGNLSSGFHVKSARFHDQVHPYH